MQNEWRDFNGGAWENEVNVRDFIQRNYKPYDGDSSFLEGPTEDTTALWQDVLELSKQEREAGGVLDMDTKIISTITSHGPAYLDKDKEKIVGFQTDKPFKRSLQPYGGIRMAIKACEDNGYKVDPEVVEYFTTHRKTHNAGVFDAYTPEMRACRSAHIITGLPDAYGRGRIIGDYRRPALYGVDRLIEDKQEQLDSTRTIMYSDVIREREELSEQIRALKMLKELAKIYGCDISKPATNVLEAAQAVYFAYLAAVKEQNGAAMSLGRTSTFLDIYAERDLREGTFTEKEIQEIIDRRREGFLVLSGDDGIAVDVMRRGGDGVISVAVNAFPRRFMACIDLAKRGDFDAAETAFAPMHEVVEALFAEGNPTGVKCALSILGLIGNRLRLPLVAGTPALEARLRELIRTYDLR